MGCGRRYIYIHSVSAALEAQTLVDSDRRREKRKNRTTEEEKAQLVTGIDGWE